MENQPEVLQDSFLAADYQALFRRQWTPWVAGILIGSINVMMFAYAKPWGVAEGVQNWGNWMLKTATIMEADLISPLLLSTSITNLGLILGAFIAALFAREFAIQVSSRRDMIRSMIGGILLGIGSVLGMGCTIGGFLSAFSALSLAGPLFMLGLIGGTYVGLRVLMWDLAREKPRTPKPAKEKTAGRIDWRRYQPLMGLGLLVLVLVFLFYDKQEFSFRATTGLRSVLIFFGLALGFINQRARFCFVRAFREPFMTGEAGMTKGAALALIVGVAGFAILKGSDLGEFREFDIFVNPSVWIGSLAGGLIFGIGMVLTGGCASGSLWRVGEGQVKFILVLAMFAISNAGLSLFLRTTGARGSWGEDAYFLPDFISWPGALILLIGIALVWILLAAWNEKSEKLVVD